MNVSTTLLLPGSFLRWGGLLTLVLAILAGLLGMHMIGGAQAPPTAPAHASSMSSGTTSSATAVTAPADAHAAASPTMSATDHGEVSDAPNHRGNTAGCGCSSSDCEIPMASHGSCTPFAGAVIPAAPQPGLVPDPAAGPTSSDHAGYKSAGRIPAAPSLTQLSISRT